MHLRLSGCRLAIHFLAINERVFVKISYIFLFKETLHIEKYDGMKGNIIQVSEGLREHAE